MGTKSVLVVEDDKETLEALTSALSRNGFRATGTSNVAETQAVAADGADFDVVILDMLLEDPDAPGVTGADLGATHFATRKYPPEFIINSGYAYASYYRQALELGAAAYLKKPTDLHTVLDHTRVLAVRRALNIDRPDAERQIQELAESSRDPMDAISRFCREVLEPELSEAIGSFLLLLTHGNVTVACAGHGTDLLRGPHGIYHRVQAVTFGESARDPVVIDVRKASGTAEECETFAAIDGASSVALADTKGLRLALVLLRGESKSESAREGPSPLSIVFARYFRGALLELLLRIVAVWTLIDIRRRAAIETFARFCDRVGEELDEILSAATDSGEIRQEGNNPNISRLSDLVHDLREAGGVLQDLVRRSRAEGPARRVFEHRINLGELIETAWRELVDTTGFQNTELVRVTGDCSVVGSFLHLQGAVLHILDWLTQRASLTPQGVQPSVRVLCYESGRGPGVAFEDSSGRLDAHLREHLFQPFASPNSTIGRGARLGLYLAKIEIEVGHGGFLEDQSDRMTGEIGHRFVAQFLPANTL